MEGFEQHFMVFQISKPSQNSGKIGEVKLGQIIEYKK